MGKYKKTRRPPTSRHENFLVEVSELIGFKSYHVVRHIFIIFTFFELVFSLEGFFFSMFHLDPCFLPVFHLLAFQLCGPERSSRSFSRFVHRSEGVLNKIPYKLINEGESCISKVLNEKKSYYPD